MTPLPPGRLDVVVDTDVMNEVDDQFALVWALLRPDRLDVLALLACPFGLTPELFAPGAGLLTELDRRQLLARLGALGMTPQDVPARTPADGVQAAYDELLRLVALAGVDVPVHRGSRAYLPDARTPVESRAARALIELAHAPRTGQLYVVAIGCATNVASALLLDPSIGERITVVWTSAYPSFWPYGNASYNLAQDVPAAQVLFDCAVPLVYVPGYYVGEELRVSGPELQAHVQGAGALGNYLWDTVRRHPLFQLDRPGATKVIWDLAPLAYLLDQDACLMREVRRPRLGEDLVWSRGAGAMLEMLDIDRDAIFADLYARLQAAAN